MSNPGTYIQSAADINHPRTLQAFRSIKLLVSWYLGISALTVVAIVLLRNHTAEVNSAVWTRRSTSPSARPVAPAGVASALLSIVMPVAIVVIIALPGTFPL